MTVQTVSSSTSIDEARKMRFSDTRKLMLLLCLRSLVGLQSVVQQTKTFTKKGHSGGRQRKFLTRSLKAMAGRPIANLIVLGTGALLRAVSQAYRQALVSVAQETVQNMAHKVSKTMAEHEAHQILGVSEKASWEETMKKYNTLFENNAKTGTFYLQSKVFQAKECLEAAKLRAES